MCDYLKLIINHMNINYSILFNNAKIYIRGGGNSVSSIFCIELITNKIQHYVI